MAPSNHSHPNIDLHNQLIEAAKNNQLDTDFIKGVIPENRRYISVECDTNASAYVNWNTTVDNLSRTSARFWFAGASRPGYKAQDYLRDGLSQGVEYWLAIHPEHIPETAYFWVEYIPEINLLYIDIFHKSDFLAVFFGPGTMNCQIQQQMRWFEGKGVASYSDSSLSCSGSRVIVTGPGGGATNRLEINTFVKNDKYFSLYIQALQKMFDDSQATTQSFFQLGGIHGLPYIAWDGAIVNPPVDLKARHQWGGYCTHGTVLFPTWHRPYVSVFEQILWNRAQEVAATYTVHKAAWKEAATTLRQPYWDWAANSVPPDEVISLTRVNITGPDGHKKLVDNPLYHYRFHPIDPSFPEPFNGWKTTLRQPTSTDPGATDDICRLKEVLANSQSSITSNIYNMLTRVTTWPAFSNHTVGDGGSKSNSLEAIHDGIHDLVGGNGHMSDLAVAGFDPIFFLHHCNVDRMLSLWSALHPGVWVTEGPSEDGTFTIPAKTSVDTNTDLTPFYNTQTSFWASAGVTDTSKLGYTYPEFNGLDMNNPPAVQKAIAIIVNKLYGFTIWFPFWPWGILPQGVVPQSSASQEAVAVAAEDNHPAPGHAYPRDWTARIEFKKFEIGHSFSVVLFLGQVPEKPKDYLISPHYVGAHHALVNSAANQCENCQNQADFVEEGYVHLSHGILEKGKLDSLEAAVVEPYLTKNLHWKAIGVDSIPVEIQSLEVKVYSTTLAYSDGSAFPIPGNTSEHNGITYGRPGGSRDTLRIRRD